MARSGFPKALLLELQKSGLILMNGTTAKFPRQFSAWMSSCQLNRLDNNALHTEPRAARLFETMMFAAAR